ncbi:epoxyqueuosine reductase QueH [Campylobacter fetus]|uniref:epoxyqueuosine reductase QueH n=1 Tax=Campylobacter fetus TaxID=196 RepID=UPI000818B0BA|nr:epoxyqueuosine reductase QueH [Campylobacter fetus]EAH8299787.1 epoxyqueuosine reductase QueH [Campylobacter fetus]EAI7232385.1 epoxyqueuosine reductase QueH [Campylobacter fetus]EAJ5690114.1 epoxyqueuosine reductase QueH [Campylobacter fetus]EAK0428330.1 epoxyqueuosine reductase QueH [Campylobacter fetus]EAK5304005.1 epoxyqueuosine reductase QueH [Campylobacter fetus]
MLVHICCSVDSHYFLQELKKAYPGQNIIGYFYDPNIHPYSEFLLRYQDVKRSCKKLGVKLICGDYDYESWLKGTKGLENEPEKGKRCEYCFDFRVGKSAQIAVELGCKKITTTLLMSPKKDFTQLENALKNAVIGTNLEPIAVDFRKNGGTTKQFELAKNDKLYHQNYCGCIFGLSAQKRENEIIDELFEPLGGQVQFGSIKSRLKLYKKVRKYEKNGLEFELIREKILNYRLKFAKVCVDGVTLPSYFLFYSHFNRKLVKFKVNENSELLNTNKDDIKLISLAKFNELGGFFYKSVSELMANPPKLKRELKIRKWLCGNFSLSPIIVLDEINIGKFEVRANSVMYTQSIEKLVL